MRYSGKSNNFSNTSSLFNYDPINGGFQNEEIVFESDLHEEDTTLNKILLRDTKKKEKNYRGKVEIIMNAELQLIRNLFPNFDYVKTNKIISVNKGF